MALINKLDNAASVVYGGATINSNTVNNTAATPTLTSNTLTYTIPTIAALGTAAIQFQVKVVGGTGFTVLPDSK